MKKSLIVSLVAALLASTSAFAGFSLPSTGNGLADKAVNKGKNMAVEQVINDKLKKQNCAFKDDKTSTDTTCNLDKVISDLTSWKNGLEQSIVGKISVNVNASAKESALASTRAQDIRNRLYQKMSWWDYTVNSSTSNGNGLGLSVSVH